MKCPYKKSYCVKIVSGGDIDCEGFDECEITGEGCQNYGYEIPIDKCIKEAKEHKKFMEELENDNT